MANEKNLKPVEKGQILNPKGRGKGNRNKSTIMKELLASKINGTDTVEQQLLKKVYEAVMSGDLKAISLVLDGAFGKDKQVVEQTNIDLISPPKIEFKEDE
jgi:hypothetical protein